MRFYLYGDCSNNPFCVAVYQKGDVASKRFALILPGRLDTKDYFHMRSHVDFLAQLGYFALSFDPPSTWEGPGSIESYTTTNYLKVINELIEHFGNRKTLLLDHSRGGSVAILEGAKNQNVTSIIAINASCGAPSAPKQESVKQGFQIEFRDMPPGTRKTKEQKIFALPINYFIDGEQHTPASSLMTCLKPKLLVYSTKDQFTEPNKVKELFEAIPDPKSIYEIDSEHKYRYSGEIVEKVNGVIGKFIRKFII